MNTALARALDEASLFELTTPPELVQAAMRRGQG